MKYLFALSYIYASLLTSSYALAATPAIDQVRMPAVLQNLFLSDWERLSQLKFTPTKDQYFEQIFSKDNSINIPAYMEQRIQYVSTGDPKDHEYDKNNFAANNSTLFLSFYFKEHILKEKNDGPEKIPFGDTVIPIDGPGIGFITLGPVYTSADTNLMDRLGTLVHEARHSDCAELPSLRDYYLLEKDLNHLVSNHGLACDHLHVKCPKGHPLAGEEACDKHPWGSYMFDYIFSKAVHTSCENCSEEEKQAALATAADDLTRLAPKLKTALKQHRLPPLDLRRLHP